MIEESKISEEDFNAIEHLLPGPDPVVRACAPRSSGKEESARIIPVADTRLDGNELKYLTECVESNWISSVGPFVQEFERRFANAVGCEFGVACANGTVALHLVLATLGISAGDEVIIPTFTMIATANAVSYTGAKPVLVDAESETWNMDPTQIEAKITAKTKAIIVVHTYGHPVEIDAIREIAERHRLYLIEDAAEAHGAAYRGRAVGSLGDGASFSFYANKIITTGEGGMVTTNDPKIAAVARRLRDHAFSTERHFWHRYRGFNYRMTNLQAAIGLAQTERMSSLVEI
ncbi:MAG TPA: DegT/DnrJ/EryC1/StrS family aminotransferase, partial [Blastocatellia bacterium]|nr:DegT/DnrJ/EryC1/StrS family aminotransferase [Blastocatellia bacterium]